MARKKMAAQLTPLELEIMKVLWERGPSTVQAVLDRLPGERQLAYTTVQTMLNLLHKKGKVRRTSVDGERAFRYAATIPKQAALRQIFADLVNRVFGGSAEQMVLSMVQSRILSPETLEELNRMVAESKDQEAEKKPDGSD